MWLHVSRQADKVIIKLPTVLDRCYSLELQCEYDTIAELLARDMDTRLEGAIEEARRSSYEHGWTDARAKRRKQTWFLNMLEIK